MTLSSANKIYLYDGDAKFIKEQVGSGYDNLTAAGVVHELIESYKQNNDVKQIQVEMQKEIDEMKCKKKLMRSAKSKMNCKR